MKRSTVLPCAVFAFFLFVPLRALADIYVVDRTDDTNAAAAQVCSGAANDCSLRGAISKANAHAGSDEIQFIAGTNGTPFTLTLLNGGGLNEDANATGDLDATDTLTITGNGSANTIIQAGTSTTNGIDKVFALNPLCQSSKFFTITNVTIRHGRNMQPSAAVDFSFTGGGLDFCGRGTSGSGLTLSGSVITLNTNVNGYGGGINIDEAAPAASNVTISNTIITANTALQNGGGINIFGDNAIVTISGSTISNNTTQGTGGVGAQGGGINIRITNQTDGDGAATPFVNITGTAITGNQGVGFGGGIDVAISGNQDVIISNTSIRNNSVVAGSSGNTMGGGLHNANTSARSTTLTNVLIADNLSAASAASGGGGVSQVSGNLMIRNTTISGNQAAADGGGVHVAGAAGLTLTDVTVSNNRADSDGNSTGSGGGINKVAGAGVATLENTLVDGNFRGSGSTASDAGGAITANYSLFGNTSGATIGGANNQLNVSARLGPLADNGSPQIGAAGSAAVLQTHALLAGSPALDNGSNALVPGTITSDQRGASFARIRDAGDVDTTAQVDIGAYEAHPSVEHIAAQVMNEDGVLALTIHYGDAANAGGGSFDAVTATSDNAVLLPNNAANISLTGSGATRTLTLTPSPNLFGVATITLTVSDTVGGTLQTMTDTFVLTVNPVADQPSVTNAVTNVNTQTASGLVVTRNPADGSEVTHIKITSITNGTLFKNDGTTAIPDNSFITYLEANAGLKFTPAANLSSPGTNFSFAVAGATSAAGAGLGPTATASITVNAPTKKRRGQVTSLE